MIYKILGLQDLPRMSQKYMSYFFAIASIAIFASCEDVVDIETADAPAQMVVDAWLSDENKSQTIRLTRSQPYFDSNFAEGIEGATVEVVVSNGSTLIFADQGGGDYSWTPSAEQTMGSIGDTYTLQISTPETPNVTASATMHAAPEIDSITVTFKEDDLSGPDGLYAEFFARDLPGLGDTYWIKAFKNGSFLNKPEELNLAYDGGFDAGAEIDNLIFIPPIREQVNPEPDSADV